MRGPPHALAGHALEPGRSQHVTGVLFDVGVRVPQLRLLHFRRVTPSPTNKVIELALFAEAAPVAAGLAYFGRAFGLDPGPAIVFRAKVNEQVSIRRGLVAAVIGHHDLGIDRVADIDHFAVVPFFVGVGHAFVVHIDKHVAVIVFAEPRDGIGNGLVSVLLRPVLQNPRSPWTCSSKGIRRNTTMLPRSSAASMIFASLEA